MLNAKRAQGTNPFDPRFGMADLFNPKFRSYRDASD